MALVADQGHDGDTGSEMQEWMHWQPVKAKRFASLRLTPARVLVGAGAVVAILAGLMPWADGIAPGRTGFEPVTYSVLGGAGDGVMLIAVSLGAAALTLHRTPAEARTRTIRLLPAILVVLAAFTWVNGRRAAEIAVEDWGVRGGSGGPAAGMWLAAAGILVMAAGTLWLLPSVIRWKQRDGDPDVLLRFSWPAVIELAAGGIGLILGAVVGMNAGLALTGPTIVGTIFLGAVFGSVLGAYAATWGARALLLRLAGGGPGDADARTRRG
jgi:hypothetical protein